jgi:hypothetical protein
LRPYAIKLQFMLTVLALTRFLQRAVVVVLATPISCNKDRPTLLRRTEDNISVVEIDQQLKVARGAIEAINDDKIITGSKEGGDR